MENTEITNLVMVPDAFEDLDALEDVLNTMPAHERFMHMNRSSGVMSPQGPTGYREIIEIHWKNMESLMGWSHKMQELVPQEKRARLAGVKILFYGYQ